MSQNEIALLAMTPIIAFVVFKKTKISSSLSIYNILALGLIVLPLLILSLRDAIPILFWPPTFIHLAFLIGLYLFYYNFNELTSKYELHKERNQFEQLIEIGEKRLRFLRKFCGQHEFTGSALAGMASAYSMLGKREKAKRYYIEALKILENVNFWRSQDKDTVNLKASLLDNLINYYLAEEDFERVHYYGTSLISLSEAKSANKIFLVKAHHNKALAFGMQGDHHNFLVGSAKARKIYREWERNDKAKQRIREKIKTFTKSTNQPTSIWISIIVFGIPLIFFKGIISPFYIWPYMFFSVAGTFAYFAVDDFVESGSQTKESIRAFSLLLEMEGDFFQSVGDLDVAQGNYIEAYDLLSNNLPDNVIEGKFRLANSFRKQASLQAKKGLLATEDPQERDALYKHAIADFDSALAIYHSLIDPSGNLVLLTHRISYASCLLNRQLAYLRLHGTEKTENETLQIFNHAEKILVSHSVILAKHLVELGLLYYWDKNYIGAKYQYDKAERITRQSPSGRFYLEMDLSYARAILNISCGNIDKALRLIKDSGKKNNDFLLQNLPVLSEKNKLSIIQENRFYLDTYVSIVHSFFPSKSLESGQLFDFVLNQKGRGVEASTASRELFSECNIPSERKAELTSKMALLTQTRRKIAHAFLDQLELVSEPVERLRELEKQRRILEEELSIYISDFRLTDESKQIDRKSIDKKLPAGSALIEIIATNIHAFPSTSVSSNTQKIHSSRYLAFVLLAGEPDNFNIVDLGEINVIDELILSTKKQVYEELDFKELGFSGISLPLLNTSPQSDIGANNWQKILAPLLTAIGTRTKLYISPDGNLSQIPFEILPTEKGERLIDLYSISYLSAGRDLMELDRPSARQSRTKSVVVADPNFDLSCTEKSSSSSSDSQGTSRHSRNLDVSQGLRRLPGTREEGEAIARLLNVKPLMDDRATKDNLFKFSKSPLILHIATHGKFLPNQNSYTKDNTSHQHRLGITSSILENSLLRSWLVLAGANFRANKLKPLPEAGNGILTAEEASSLNLSGTALVTLSACETGKGDSLYGEGVFGLRRAFVLAGAKTLVMSLWKVPDQQSKELMLSFYSRLVKGEPCSEALQNAQLELKEKYPNPYYWGAFICQGYTGTIPDLAE
ncbi:MAG: CHAT domain-containing tetratricopeptide repeat protein [Cyanobacteria bacterium J06560_6]